MAEYMICPRFKQCTVTCSHKVIHVHRDDCDDECGQHDMTCKAIPLSNLKKVRSLDKRIAKARVFKLKDKETWLYEKKQVLLKYLFMED